jgi:hypothetical protein
MRAETLVVESQFIVIVVYSCCRREKVKEERRGIREENRVMFFSGIILGILQNFLVVLKKNLC